MRRSPHHDRLFVMWIFLFHSQQTHDRLLVQLPPDLPVRLQMPVGLPAPPSSRVK
jgi:hypothetical protein